MNQNNPTSAPLLIFDASAGSGKTYNLVRYYLRLLLVEDENKADIDQILAMTFTNKACLEMKTRIINDLYKLTMGLNTKFSLEMANFCGISQEKLKARSQIELRKILHHFENFNVITIDKFNLRLIRSFSKDLQLPDNFEISVDEAEILENAIDELLGSINPNNNEPIYNLASNFITDSLEDEDRWELKNNLLNHASLLSKENMFDVVKRLIEVDFSNERYLDVKKEYEALKLEVTNIQTRLIELFNNTTFDLNKLVGKNSLYNSTMKTVFETFSNVKSALSLRKLSYENHIASNIEKNPDVSPFYTQYQHIIETFINNWEVNLKTYKRFKSFNSLALLKELAIRMEKIRKNNSIVLVAEFNKLISELVQQEDAPYIYERLGNRYSHYFLDEFQDTSRLQWLNLIPLIHNSISQNKLNFIVGDAKQSIYRFKNGIAEQFIALPEIYNPEGNPDLSLKSNYFKQNGFKQGLSDNWRSAENIIEFNNAVFNKLKEDFGDKGKSYYSSISQNPKGKKQGYIEIHSYDKKSENDPSIIWVKWVEDCIKHGYKPADICILGRTSKECNLYANTLKRLNYEVVSSDSLLISSDIHVQLVISFLKWKVYPKNVQFASAFAHDYYSVKYGGNEFEYLIELYTKDSSKSVFDSEYFLYQHPEFVALLKAGFQNIYSLIINLFAVLKLDPIHNSYLQQLLDLAYQFDVLKGPDLLSFISMYKEKADKINVLTTENENAIKIMSAHKSKGLEFPIVIIPSLRFLTSGGKNKSNYLIESGEDLFITQLSEFDEGITEIRNYKEQEKINAELDALNLVYVAFTRPIDRLYGIINNSTNFEKKLHQAIFSLPIGEITGNGEKYVLGKFPELTQHDKQNSAAYTPDQIVDHLWFPDISLQPTKEQQENQLTNAQRIGNQFHWIMEHATDKETALAYFEIGVLKGKIEIEFKSIIQKLINDTFENKELMDLYARGKHLGERSIVVAKNETLRPDKMIISENETIVIDFKTGEKLSKHENQVKNYVQVLHEMNYPNVKGYLYYSGGMGLMSVN